MFSFTNDLSNSVVDLFYSKHQNPSISPPHPKTHHSFLLCITQIYLHLNDLFRKFTKRLGKRCNKLLEFWRLWFIREGEFQTTVGTVKNKTKTLSIIY